MWKESFKVMNRSGEVHTFHFRYQVDPKVVKERPTFEKLLQISNSVANLDDMLNELRPYCYKVEYCQNDYTLSFET